MENTTSSLDAIQDIRKIMERSSRFISLSGLSGVSVGFIALVSSYFAYDWIMEFYYQNQGDSLTDVASYPRLIVNLLGLALLVFATAIASAFYFTWRKARTDNVSLLDKSSRRLIINLFIPLAAGACFVLGMLYHGIWQFVAPACLIFYGLGCVNGSKYTYTDIRYLGICEIILGIINMFYIGYGLYFWAFGFGVLHIVYGVIMWYKYERQPVA